MQPKKAKSPMLVTPSGMVIEVRLLQLEKAPILMFATPSGRVTEASPVRLKAPPLCLLRRQEWLLKSGYYTNSIYNQLLLNSLQVISQKYGHYL